MNTVNSASKSGKIADILADEIENRVYHENNPLPSENTMAKRFQVNRMTIRKALDDLVTSGFIEKVHGKGSFVKSVRTLPNISNIPNRNYHFIILADDMFNVYNYYQIAALQQVFWAQNSFTSLILESAVGQSPYKLLEKIREFGCAGVLIYLKNYQTTLKWLQFLKEHEICCAVPMYIGGYEDCFCGSKTEYGVFTERASEEAVNYLVKLGHRRIGFLADSAHGAEDYSLRLRGYLQGLEKNGLNCRNHVVASIDSGAWEEALLRMTGPDTCTAIMAYNDAEAALAIKLLKLRHINVPENVSIMGFGAFPSTEFASITTIPVPYEEFAIELYQVLCQQVRKEKVTHRNLPYIAHIKRGVTCSPIAK